MARFDGTDGDRFFGNPITVTIIAGSYSGDINFRRVCLEVTVLQKTGIDDQGKDIKVELGKYEFATPVSSNNEKVKFDVSSALRSAVDTMEYSPTSLTYPMMTFNMRTWDEYMIDGQSRQSGETYSFIGGYFYAGALSDRERLSEQRPVRYSRKPWSYSPEILYMGMKFLLPGPWMTTEDDEEVANPPSCTELDAEAVTEVNVYPVGATNDCYEMRFINGFGVHESVHVQCLRQAEVDVKTERYVIAKRETLTGFSRGIAIKKNNHEKWKMSSGPQTLRWQEWWLHEFLTARWAWIKVDGTWLSVHIIPEETVTGIDRVKGDALTVTFTIEFDITGSPFK